MIYRNENLNLSGARETLLITLRAKALDSRLRHSVLNDRFADSIFKTIKYDFTKFGEFYKSNNIIVIRAKQFDEWLKEFLATNENATVVNLACGLDSRVKRVDPDKTVFWYDIDFPDVIEIRRNFFVETQQYKMIGSSALDPQWLQDISPNRPTVILTEGLLEYLDEKEVQSLFNMLTGYFVQGQLIFDVMSSFAIESGKKRLKAITGAEHKWAVNSPEAVDRLDSQLQRISDLSVFKSAFIKELSAGYRFIYRIMSYIPAFRNMMRLMRYGF